MKRGIGIQCVLIDKSNAVKSSLLNQIANSDTAIVSEQSGKTGDAINVQLNLNGWPLTISDTAGTRNEFSLMQNEESNSRNHAFSGLTQEMMKHY